MSTNLPQSDPSDDEGRVYFSATPTQGPSVPSRNPVSRSASRSSAWSVDIPPHHHQGTSYYPSSSPSARPTSPISRRINSSSSRYRSFSGAERRSTRSTSVSTGGKGGNEDAAQGDASDEDEDLTPGPERGGDDGDVTGLERDREFTEEDPLTLKDRQSLINVEHPFGLPIWKPALYKKSRTVTRDAETEVHSVPSATLDWHYIPGNVFWTVFFGWWIALVALVVSGILSLVPFGGRRYAWLLLGLSWYILWPFGKYVEGDVEEGEDGKDETEDEVGNGGAPEPDSSNRSTVRGQSPILECAQESDSSARVPLTSHSTISTITPIRAREQMLQNSVESTPLVHDVTNKVYGAINPSDPIASMEVASAEHWLGKAVFWLIFISLLAPILLVVTLVCWGLVITIPMAKLNWELFKLLWNRPLNIRFCAAPPPTVVPTQPPLSEQNAASEAVTSYTIHPTRLSAGQVAPHLSGTPRSTVLLCTYRAIGFRYYKYTVGGVNIMFINLLPFVFFVIFDGFVLLPFAERREHAGNPLTGFLALLASQALIFVLSLLSVVPLSYFIGMAVASISAQSSIGMGAVINATFGSIIEIILYAIALTQGKGHLVEGSIVGSILAGVLLMPGLSMCGGALRKKEQKFNAKSAGVTSTMLIMAIIGVLTPTMFYQVYGNVCLQMRSCSMFWLTDISRV
jgi:Ca2+:H+ antiporter